MSTQNPIQERVDMLLEKWTTAINTPGIRLVRILAAHDEREMVSDFFEYMLALDSKQEDFVLVLSEPYTTYAGYEKDLLEEIEEEIKLWNTSKLPEGVPFEQIEWNADYSLGSDKNVTQLLVKNLNQLADYLIPDRDMKMSVILRMPNIDSRQACMWLNDLLKVPTVPHLVFGVSDSVSNKLFDEISYKPEVFNIFPELDMDGAMEQLASLGNPNEPETPYRIALVKLMNSVKERKEKETMQYAKECLGIASTELKKNLNWLVQIVTVYTVLYNDQVGYKNYDEAIYFADKAVESALLTEDAIEPEMSLRLIGQTHTGRGALFSLKKNWDKALEDYQKANQAYQSCNDHVMTSETYRLCGWTSEKIGNQALANQYYLDAYPLVHKLAPDLLKGSTFPLILKKLANSTERQKHISNQQMDDDLVPIWGENWRQEIENYGKIKR